MTRVARTGLIALLLLVSVRSLAAADTLADVRGRGRLVWGGDQEGGGPYVYPSDDDPSRAVGFEVDLAARLAGYLGVAPQFFQGPWDKMPELLRTRKVDIVLNGYEWSADRLATMDATIPYYVYGLQLLARADDASLAAPADLAARRPDGRKRRLGVLTGSAAEAYARRRVRRRGRGRLVRRQHRRACARWRPASSTRRSRTRRSPRSTARAFPRCARSARRSAAATT